MDKDKRLEYKFNEIISKTHVVYITDDENWLAILHITYKRKKEFDDEWETTEMEFSESSDKPEDAMFGVALTSEQYLYSIGYDVFNDSGNRDS
jgi:hypothetical protein